MYLKKLNIDCGTDLETGYVNLDSTDLSGVDVVCDSEKLPPSIMGRYV